MQNPDKSHSPQHQTTMSTWAVVIWKALQACEIDPVPLFNEAGIALEGLDDPLYRYPVASMTALWELAVAKTENEAFGLLVAEHVNPSTFFALGYSTMASESGVEAVERIKKFSDVVTNGISFDIYQKDGLWELVLDMKPGYQDLSPPCVEAIFASLLHICQTYIQIQLDSQQVEFAHREPKNTKDYEVFFGCDVLFKRPKNILSLNVREGGEQRFSTANPALAKANDLISEDYLQHHGKSNFGELVRALIFEHIDNELLSQKVVAQHLNISERKLQYQLSMEETSYKTIVDEVRRYAAERWLKAGTKSISEIAWALGFKEVSSFTRAFKRWNNQSPSQYAKANA